MTGNVRLLAVQGCGVLFTLHTTVTMLLWIIGGDYGFCHSCVDREVYRVHIPWLCSSSLPDHTRIVGEKCNIVAGFLSVQFVGMWHVTGIDATVLRIIFIVRTSSCTRQCHLYRGLNLPTL